MPQRPSPQLFENEIQHGKLPQNQICFEHLRSVLQAGFAAPESDYEPLTAADVFARNTHLTK